MATILIVSPNDDEPKKYARYYLHIFAEKASRKGHFVVFLREPLLSNFEEAVIKYDPGLVILNGHGGRKGITGLDSHVILGVKSYDPELRLRIIAQNPELMKGRIVYLLSCFTAKELAPRLVDYGAIAVAGYASSFIFLSTNSPEQDRQSRNFFTAAMQLPLYLLEGENFGVGCRVVKNAFLKYVEEAEERRDFFTAKYFWHDYLNFKAFGNMRASL